MADTTKGYGTTLGSATTSDGTYTSISQVRDIEDGGVTVEEVDVSHMASPSQAREKEPDWKNAENVTFDALYTDAQYAALLGFTGVMRFFKITTPDGAVTGPFQGFISALGKPVPMAGRISSNITITVSGVYTFTAGA